MFEKWRSRHHLRGPIPKYAAVIPIGILRFCIFVPLGYYSNFAGNHWNTIKGHAELHDGIYSPTIAVGEQLAARWGYIGYCWTFSAWIPAMLFPAPFDMVFTAVDGVLTGYIAYATHLLAGYSPTNPSKCLGSGAHEFQLPPGANESFFDAAARLNATVTDSVQMCKTFANEWQYGVALTTLLGLLTAVSLVFSFCVSVESYWTAQREQKSMSKYLLHTALQTVMQAVRYFVLILIALLWHLPVLLFNCFPVSVKSRVRFAWRYGAKAGQGLEEKTEVQLKTMTTKLSKKDGRVYRGKDHGEPANLADFIGVYDMLITVVEHLHYVDVMNLGLVSRSVREAILPADAYAQRTAHFKTYTCRRGSKKFCWSCTIQICDDCNHLHSLEQTDACFHLDTCRPYCTKCYFVTVQRSVIPSYRRSYDARACKHTPSKAPNFLIKWLRGPQYSPSRELQRDPVVRQLCGICHELDHDALLEKRLRRSRWELRAHERINSGGDDDGSGEWLRECLHCKGALGSGPRWWVCTLCKKECTSMLHGAWGKGARQGEAV